MGGEECEPREGGSRKDFGSVRLRDVSRRHPGWESVHGRGGVRYASRIIHPETESVRVAGRVKDAPSLPPFKNTRRLKLSTLVVILFSAFFNFLSQPWFSTLKEILSL